MFSVIVSGVFRFHAVSLGKRILHHRFHHEFLRQYLTKNACPLRFMHLSIEIPTPPPTPGQGGGMWGFLWYWKARFARGGGGFLRICFAHSSKWGSEVGIGLVPSFLTVISAHGHWCRWLDCSAVLCSFVSVLVKRG